MPRDDYLFDVNQAGTIVNRDAQTIRRWYGDDQFMNKYPEFIQRIPNPSRGQDDVYISASVLAKVARDKNIRVNETAVLQYAEGKEDVHALFKEERTTIQREQSQEIRPEPVAIQPVIQTGAQQEVIDILKDQIAKLEQEKRELREELRGRDGDKQELNDRLLEEVRSNADKYQTLAMQKESIDSAHRKLIEAVRILNQSTNRDIERVQSGALDPRQVSFLPIPDDQGELIFPQAPIIQEQPKPRKNIVIEPESEEEESILRTPAKSEEEQSKEEKETIPQKKGLFKRLFGSK